MAARYYDDIIIAKLKRWIPENSKLRVLKPDETKRLFELTAEDNNDQPFQLPIIALSRDNSIEILQTTKNLKSFDGTTIYQDQFKTIQMNVIPIRLQYQLDIYTKTYEEGDEYLRNFLFKLINNPTLIIEIPYNDSHIQHIANIRIQNTVSDTSSISERIFPGQFTRWTIQFEIQDAFLFSIPYKRNWKLIIDDDITGALEIYTETDYKVLVDSEELPFVAAKPESMLS